VKPLDGRDSRRLATRRALRTATLDLALERGLAAVPVEEVAARAGVSTRTFFNYFATKEDAVLLEIPGIGDEELARFADGRGVDGLWAELGELFATDAERAVCSTEDLPRLLRLYDRSPGLVPRQLGRFMRLETRLADAVVARLGNDPADRMRAELIAAAMTAGRAGANRWGHDTEGRPVRFHVESAFALLAGSFAARQ
jgi:AcrR family transcriptional regulator